MGNQTSPSHKGPEDDVDGCDIEFTEEEATLDEELPTAIGGQQAVPRKAADSDEIDGCDLNFAAEDAMTDAELPPSIGGVS